MASTNLSVGHEEVSQEVEYSSEQAGYSSEQAGYSLEQSSDKMSISISHDDSELNVAFEQDSPPPETDRFVNNPMSAVPSFYSQTPAGTSKLSTFNNEKPKDTVEASKIEEKAGKEHCMFRCTAALCTGLEKSGKTSLCNLLMDKNASSSPSGNSHSTFIKWTTSSGESEWREINSEETLSDVTSKLSNYNRPSPEEPAGGVLDMLFLLDVNVPMLALCLLQRILVTFVTYKMQGKKFDNCPRKFLADEKRYSQFVREFLSSACIGQNDVLFVGMCEEANFRFYHDEAEVVNKSIKIIKGQINCPIETFPITIQRINNQYLHLVSMQNHKDEHFKEIKSKLESVVGNNCTEEVQLCWMVFYFRMQKFCITNNTCIVEYAIAHEKIWKVVCGSSNEDEFKNALKFFHKLGALFYFDSVEGINNFVITDLRWIFDNLKILYSIKGSTDQCDVLKYEGQLMPRVIEAIQSEHDQSRKVKFSDFVKLLEHLKFVAPVNKVNYFIPSILNSYEGEKRFPNFVTSEFEPLLITFSSGSLHHSVFCYLAAYMNDNCKVSPNWSKLSYSEGKMDQCTFKNLITFSANIDKCRCYVCIFDRTFFLEIHIYSKPGSQKGCPANLHSTVLKFVEDSLKAVCERDLNLPYGDFKRGFSCCMCEMVEKHMMEVQTHENSIFAKCITTSDNEELDSKKYTVWFNELVESVEESVGKENKCTGEYNEVIVTSKEATDNGTSKEATDIVKSKEATNIVTSKEATNIATSKEATDIVKCKEATDNATATGFSKKSPTPTLRLLIKFMNSIDRKWFEVGVKLLGNEDIINDIKKNHPRNKQCYEMFRLWLQQKKPLPSWERLISVLKSKEIGMTEVAEEILKQYDGGQMNTQDYHSELADSDIKSGYQYGRRYTKTIKRNSKMVTGIPMRSRLPSGISQRSFPVPLSGDHDGYDKQPHSVIVDLSPGEVMEIY